MYHVRSTLAAIAACALLIAGCGGSAHPSATSHVAAARHVASSQCPGYTTPYGCQAHSPTFGLPPQLQPHIAPATGIPTLEQLDTTTVSALAGLRPAAVAGYLSGFWPTFGPLSRAFPSARHVPIAIRALPVYPSLVGKLVCLDIEPGDASPSEAGPWARGEHRLGAAPCEYANLSTMPAVRASLSRYGALSYTLLWDANWTFRAHLDRGYSCTQWTDHVGNRNADESTCATTFYTALNQPRPRPAAVPWSSAEVQIQGARPSATVTLRLARGHWTIAGARSRVHSLPYNQPPLGK